MCTSASQAEHKFTYIRLCYVLLIIVAQLNTVSRSSHLLNKVLIIKPVILGVTISYYRIFQPCHWPWDTFLGDSNQIVIWETWRWTLEFWKGTLNLVGENRDVGFIYLISQPSYNSSHYDMFNLNRLYNLEWKLLTILLNSDNF